MLGLYPVLEESSFSLTGVSRGLAKATGQAESSTAAETVRSFRSYE